MTYATKIKKLRDEMLLTQEEFGEILGVSLVTVNRWENGKFEPAINCNLYLMFCMVGLSNV